MRRKKRVSARRDRARKEAERVCTCYNTASPVVVVDSSIHAGWLSVPSEARDKAERIKVVAAGKKKNNGRRCVVLLSRNTISFCIFQPTCCVVLSGICGCFLPRREFDSRSFFGPVSGARRIKYLILYTRAWEVEGALAPQVGARERGGVGERERRRRNNKQHDFLLVRKWKVRSKG